MIDSLRLYVEKITNLPSLPAIAHEIIALADETTPPFLQKS
jgi:hypothetical protein